MSATLQERVGCRVRAQKEGSVRRILARGEEGRTIAASFETAVDTKIASAKDPSQNAYHEFVEGAHLVYLRHPQEHERRIALLEQMGGDLVFQFERANNGVKRSLFGLQDRERIASRMLSLDSASVLTHFIANPGLIPIDRVRVITELGPNERALVEAKGLRTQ